MNTNKKDEFEIGERILNDIDLATHENDYLSKIENENADRVVKEYFKSGFHKEKQSKDINLKQNKAITFDDNVSQVSKIEGPHEDGGCQDTSIISIPDMLKIENNKKAKMLLEIYKNPHTKSESIRKLIDN